LPAPRGLRRADHGCPLAWPRDPSDDPAGPLVDHFRKQDPGSVGLHRADRRAPRRVGTLLKATLACPFGVPLRVLDPRSRRIVVLQSAQSCGLSRVENPIFPSFPLPNWNSEVLSTVSLLHRLGTSALTPSRERDTRSRGDVDPRLSQRDYSEPVHSRPKTPRYPLILALAPSQAGYHRDTGTSQHKQPCGLPTCTRYLC
jgi:hypothetical protein